MKPYFQTIRKRIGNDLLILPAVAACFIKDNKILLVRKRDSNIWAIPGGAVEPIETAVDALKREMQEELDSEIIINRLIGIYTSPNYDFTYPNGDNVHPFILSFSCSMENSNKEFLPNDEIIEFRYFSRDELPSDMMTCCRDKALDAFKHSDEFFLK